METRFTKTAKIFDITITAIAGMLSVGVMLYAMFYVACLVMIWLYFFNRLDTHRFNYWCSVSVGITVLLRDILFAPPLVNYPLHLLCLTLSVFLVLLLTYFYARKDWESYTKSNLWLICIVDMIIAALYNIDIYLEPQDEYTDYLLIEIWIRPTITYGLVACFVTEQKVKDWGSSLNPPKEEEKKG